MSAPVQLSMLDVVTTPSSSPVGLDVILPRQCHDCGSDTAIIGSSAGPHSARLKCCGCGRHRGWLSAGTFQFLSDVIDTFGRPTAPITVTMNSRKSADVQQ